MQIQRIALTQVRKFEQLTLNDLNPGLNIFSGPNEAGKSTVASAIRAAFFERYNSKSAQDLQPWGHSGASPTVEIDFALGGLPHQLRKSFLNKARCDLQIQTQRLSGKEAEDHLAQVLGFSYASRGASKAEQWGIPGLLWIQQGAGHELPVAPARDHLHAALDHSAAQAGGAAISALVASQGDRLLEHLQTQRDALLTKAGKPRGALAEVAAQHAQHVEQLQQLHNQITQYQGQVDALAEHLQAQARDQAEKPQQAWQQALQAAREQAQALRGQQQQLQASEQRAAQVQATLDALGQQLLHYQQQAQALRERTLQQQQSAESWQQARQQSQQAQAAADTAQQQQQAALQQLRQAQWQASQDQASLQCADAQQAVLGLQERLDHALHAQQQLQSLQQELADLALQAGDIQRLRESERALHKAEAQRQALATRLQWQLLPAQSLCLRSAQGEQQLQGTDEQWLDGAAELDIEGLGQIRITPGGEKLAEGARAHEAAGHALQQALRALGLKDMAQAEARWLQVQQLQARLELAQQTVQQYAGRGGLQPLQAELVQWQQRARQAQAALALPAPHPGVQALDAEQAQAQWQHAQAQQQRAQALATQAQQALLVAASVHEQSQRELAALQAQQQDGRQQDQQAQAREQQQQLQAQHAQLSAEVGQLQAALQSAQPDFVQQDIQRLEQSIAQHSRASQEREQQMLVLQTQLHSASALGLEEQAAQEQALLVQSQRHQQQLQGRADALDLLVQQLQHKRSEALQRLHAPLQLRLQHYLSLLMPGAQLALSQDLVPATLSRSHGGAALDTGALEQLSFGTQEQLALISRFAYADLLREAGRATLLMLDDSLVHSDAQRLAQMKRVIFDASQRHQVLLFTCHPQDWQDMGAAVRRIGTGP